jgi:tRNA threonylcarbamoyl adenosine modification protein (Sua5/YciO/YrdC/YwlC family)
MTPAELARYVQCLRAGGVVACPTETLVGLLADALSAQAVDRVVAIKRRGPEPIALILPDVHALARVAEPLSELALALATRHWPGPLTLIVRALPGLPAALVRDGTIGVRVPGPSPALELARAFAGPLTATSCNPSGLPAARTEAEVRGYFPSELDDIVPGDAPGGLPSTVVDATGLAAKMIRQGAISLTE